MLSDNSIKDALLSALEKQEEAEAEEVSSKEKMQQAILEKLQAKKEVQEFVPAEIQEVVEEDEAEAEEIEEEQAEESQDGEPLEEMQEETAEEPEFTEETEGEDNMDQLTNSLKDALQASMAADTVVPAAPLTSAQYAPEEDDEIIEQAVITADMVIEGSIVAKSHIRMEGVVIGNIMSTNDLFRSEERRVGKEC